MSPRFRRELLPGTLAGLCVAFAFVVVWLAGEGLTPLGWLRYMAAVSYGDRFNASPLLGGAFVPNLSPHTLVTPLLLSAIVLGLLCVFARDAEAFGRGGDEDGYRLWFAFGVVALNLLFTLALITRHFYYGIYWALPLLPVAVAATSRVVKSRGGRPSAAMIVVAVLWAGLLAAYVAVRAAKCVEVAATWEARDPERVERFVRQNVPPGSKVYGPQRYFFYAVERAGSSYVYAEKWTTLGLAAAVPGFERYSRAPAPRRPHAKRFLLWEAGRELPPRFAAADFVARLPQVEGSRSWLSRFSPGGEHPVFDLYELADAPSSEDDDASRPHGDTDRGSPVRDSNTPR